MEELKSVNKKCEYVGAVGHIVQEFPLYFSLGKWQLGKSNLYTDSAILFHTRPKGYYQKHNKQ